MIHSGFKKLYKDLVEMQKTILKMYPTQIEEIYMVNTDTFSKELLRDPSEFEYPAYMLP